MMMTLIIVIVIIIIRSLFLFYPLGNEIMFVSSTYVGVVLAPNTTKIAFPRDEWEKAVHCTCTYIHISISYILYPLSYIHYLLTLPVWFLDMRKREMALLHWDHRDGR